MESDRPTYTSEDGWQLAPTAELVYEGVCDRIDDGGVPRADLVTAVADDLDCTEADVSDAVRVLLQRGFLYEGGDGIRVTPTD
ncbi:hypothetical protein BRD17_00125 [Halobacteriales archaeon SW_7_68_16]|nr:MAG: hypothetical protein BRD17_00125 [Halobacteriales archaeon SW_7_68_16]